MKITHVYPRVRAPFDREQTPIGSGVTEQDVWEEIRTTTLRDGGVLFIDTHQYAQEEFFEELDNNQYDGELVQFLSLDPLKRRFTYHPKVQSEASWLEGLMGK